MIQMMIQMLMIKKYDDEDEDDLNIVSIDLMMMLMMIDISLINYMIVDLVVVVDE